MPVGYPSWFNADWSGIQTTGAEVLSEYFEDLRKFFACTTTPIANMIDEAALLPDTDITMYKEERRWEAEENPNGKVYSGQGVYKWYGEYYVFVCRNDYKTNSWMYANPPTTENDNPAYGPIVTHEEAVGNENWILWPCPSFYSHWDYNSGRYSVSHHGTIDQWGEKSWHFYDCILPAHRWLPFDTKPVSHPPVGAEIRRDHHTQKLNTCWQRNIPSLDPEFVYLPTEITIEQPEPYDPNVSTPPGQIYHAPYLSDETTLACTAYQNAAMFWSDLGGNSWLKKISGDSTDDLLWQEWWARYRPAIEFVLNESNMAGVINFPTGGTAASAKYLCIKSYGGGLGITLDNTTYWSPDFYQPSRFTSIPEWVGYGSDWLGCNASGFEGMLKDFGYYDWWWCASIDGNQPAHPNWFVRYLKQNPAWEIMPRGCWRRMFRYTFGKPKKSNGEEIEDWKIWPGVAGDPPGWNETTARQLMVTQEEYTATGNSWQFCVAPTDAQIQSAYNALDAEVKADCVARHGPAMIDHSVSPAKPYYEAKHQMVNDIWGVLRYWQYVAATDFLAQTPMVIMSICSAQGEWWNEWELYNSPEELQTTVRALTYYPWLATPWAPSTYYPGGSWVSETPPPGSIGILSDVVVINGKAGFLSGYYGHTSGTNFITDYNDGLWSTPRLPDIGTLGTHNGVKHHANPTTTYSYGGAEHFEETAPDKWVRIGYTFGFAKYDLGWQAFGDNTNYTTGNDNLFDRPYKITAATLLQFNEWDDLLDRTIRLSSVKSLKLRLAYRPVIKECPLYHTYDGCALTIDGGRTVNTTPVETPDEQLDATRNAYFSTILSAPIAGEKAALVKIDIAADWPFNLVTDWNTGKYCRRRTEVNIDLTSQNLGIILEIDWDRYEDFVNA